MSFVNLDAETRSVIVGSLLGDGCIHKHNSLQIEQGIRQAEYVQWKYRMLRPVIGRPPRIISRLDIRNGKTYQSLRFYTRCVFGDFRKMFYDGNKKIIPANLGDVLDELALSVWFMDDGGRGAHTLHGVVFNTSCYSKNEQFFLKQVLFKNFRIEVNVHRVGSGYQLYVTSGSYRRFHKCVFPHMIPMMRYKLVDPVTTDFRKRCGMR